jgi:hypothetical protein
MMPCCIALITNPMRVFNLSPENDRVRLIKVVEFADCFFARVKPRFNASDAAGAAVDCFGLNFRVTEPAVINGCDDWHSVSFILVGGARLCSAFDKASALSPKNMVQCLRLFGDFSRRERIHITIFSCYHRTKDSNACGLSSFISSVASQKIS